MATPLRVLILEDNPADARLIVYALRQAQFDVEWQRVDAEAEYLHRLSAEFDVILSDYSMPQFNAIQALQLLRERGLDIPFIIISGSIGEDIAVAALQQGAADYLLKDRMGRLGEAVRHALEQGQFRKQRREDAAALLERTRLATLTADVGVALTRSDGLRDILHVCTESMVRNLDAAFARIWTLNEADNVLELEASAGMYTHLNGPHAHVPVGQLKIGRIAQERAPHLTNDVINDPQVSDPEWARREGMVSFAGYPLIVEDRLVGVVAMFARQKLSRSTLAALASAANLIALGVQRRRAEAERDALLVRQRMQIDRMPLGYMLLDAECRIIDWNATAEQIFGYSRAEVLGMGPPFEKILPSSAWVAGEDVIRRLRAGDMAAHAVNENQTKDGRIILCEWSNTPLLDSHGDFQGVISVARDITEQVRLEEQVRLAQRRLQHVVSSSPAVLFTLAFDGDNLYPTWISDNVREMMGYTPEEVFQTDWWHQRIHPDDHGRTWAEIQTKFFADDRLMQEYRFRHKDGTYHWVHGEMRLLRDKAGQRLEVVGSWSDITERKQLEEQYRQAQKMEAIGNLAGGVAHDFNNLLTIIMGYSQLCLGSMRPEDPLYSPLNEIRKAGERATGLTRQLLAFSRKQVLMPVVLNLNTILADMEKMLRRLIHEDVALTVLPDAQLWQVKADPGQIEQVVMNIAVNARDAMPQGGKLLIETKNVEFDAGYAQAHAEARPGQYVLLALSDTGCGMDASVRARIFEPFFTTKGPTKGTGLGLATVFGIVKQSGGHIEVYSEVGRGTTFKIYLPRDASGKPVASAASSREPVRGGAETILLVEDEDGVRTLAMTVLQQHGYTVLDARHGGDALLICETRAEAIDLMITDVVMPHFSGRQLAERLATRQPKMKVLFMSGYTDDAIVHHGVLDSGMPFLQKPFAPEALVRKVREVLDAAGLPRKAGPQ